MGDIFTHSKVTVSNKSHLKQISAQMTKLVRLDYSSFYIKATLLNLLVMEAALLLQ